MNTQAHDINGIEEFITRSQQKIGPEWVITDDEMLDLYSVDFSEQRLARAAVIIQPGSTEDLQSIVALARQFKIPMVPRGGSMSYTLGAVPQQEGSVIIDFKRMNRILKIDVEDMYILVEPGATWADVKEALRDYDYEIQFQGPFSGIRSTVGGALGNCAVGFGKGDVADYLMGLEVVLADGRLLNTGALAVNSEYPSLSWYGPDLTRLFINDAGSLGLKSKACFRLARKPGGVAYRSWGFNDEDQALEFMIEAGRLGVASDIFMFGPYHHNVFGNRPKPEGREAWAMVREVIRKSSGHRNAVRNLWGLARGGKLTFLKKYPYSIHLSVKGSSQKAADASMKSLRKLAKSAHGINVPPTLVLALHAAPFGPIDDLMVGLEGESCFPSNCTVALSQGQKVKRALDVFFEEQSAFMQENGLTVQRLYITVKQTFGVEPIIYWKGKMSPLRYNVLSDKRKRQFGDMPENVQATKAAVALRHKMVEEVFARFRPAHVQIGKYYPYRESLGGQDCWSVLQDIKWNIDPDGLMNPGALGLECIRDN